MANGGGGIAGNPGAPPGGGKGKFGGGNGMPWGGGKGGMAAGNGPFGPGAPGMPGNGGMDGGGAPARAGGPPGMPGKGGGGMPAGRGKGKGGGGPAAPPARSEGGGGKPAPKGMGGGMPPWPPYPPGWFWGSIGLLCAWPSAAYDEVMESMTDCAFSWPISAVGGGRRCWVSFGARGCLGSRAYAGSSPRRCGGGSGRCCVPCARSWSRA